SAFESSFLKGGYYAFSNPKLPNNCTLVLNTVQLMTNYIADPKWNAHNGLAPAKSQLKWLTNELKVAKQAGQRVWLIYHVPPGIDAFSAKNNLDPQLNAKFLALLDTFGESIEAAFAGHSHLDSFRLINAKGKHPTWLHVSPSITPNHHRGRSAYQIFSYSSDSNATTINDYQTRHMDYSTFGDSTWRVEYDWKRQFCHSECSYNYDNLQWLYQQFSAAPSSSRYQRAYEAVTTLTMPDSGSSISRWHNTYCSIANLDHTSFTACRHPQ
ncbi:MAG: hypothetical protein AAF404_22540, partial [Pseudomonadota bacterium]